MKIPLIKILRIQDELKEAIRVLNRRLADASSAGMRVDIDIDELHLIGCVQSQKIVTASCLISPDRIDE